MKINSTPFSVFETCVGTLLLYDEPSVWVYVCELGRVVVSTVGSMGCMSGQGGSEQGQCIFFSTGCPHFSGNSSETFLKTINL